MKKVIFCLVMIVSLCGAVQAITSNAYVATVLGSNAYTIQNAGTQLYYHPQPDTSYVWHENGSTNILTYDYSYKVSGITYSGTSNRDGMKTFACSDIAYGQRLDNTRIEFDYYTGPDTTGFNMPTLTMNILLTDGAGNYGMWSASSGGTAYTTTPIGTTGWSHCVIENRNRTNSTWGKMNELNPGHGLSGDRPYWDEIQGWTIAGFYDYLQSPDFGFGAWDSTLWGELSNVGEAVSANKFGVALAWGDTVGGKYEDGNGEIGSLANRPYGQAGRLINNYKITIGQGIDEVVYDVIFVPEPATICLLALGAIGLFRSKKINWQYLKIIYLFNWRETHEESTYV